MKNREEQIQNKFIALIQKLEINEISVELICKELNIKRQTFYYHFQSIYDVIFSIFYINKLEFKNCTNLKNIIEDLHTFFINYEVLYKKIIDTYAEDILVEFINSYIYRSLKKYFINSNITNDNFIKYYSKTISFIVLENIKKDFNVDEIINDINNFKKILININI